ncbi:MAG: hypothetical protein KatS3mg030_265 [Saprospiraceae bacterium]|nr:MAG: hypothetical protein KatS3mg030_265 [Saprospiraceae bacterium]
MPLERQILPLEKIACDAIFKGTYLYRQQISKGLFLFLNRLTKYFSKDIHQRPELR